MAYTKYSLTPSSNTAAPPDGAPEGMLPSAVNDTMRDMMSQIRDCGDGIRGGTYTMTAPVITGGSINGTTTITTSGAISYTGTLTGGTGVVNLGSGQFYKDASGNVGIGKTPSTTLDVNGPVRSTLISLSGTGITGGTTAFSAGTISTNSDWGMYFRAPTGSSATAEYAWVNAGGTERMRIDSSGNVGIGTSSPGAALQVNKTKNTTTAIFGTTTTLAANDWGQIGFSDGTSTSYSAIRNIFLNPTANGSTSLAFLTTTTGNVLTEAMRIDASGNLLVGATAQFNNGKECVAFNGTSNYGISIKDTVDQATARFIGFINGSGTVIGSIDRVTTTNAVQYLTTSDYRLKENVLPMTGALDKVKSLKPVTYDWKTGGSSQGFIAHELQAVVPDCVSGQKDAVDKDGNPKYQGLDTSYLVATLTSAIQEQQAMIEELKAKVAALEAA